MSTNNNKEGVFEIKTQQFEHKERVYVCAPLNVKSNDKILQTVCKANKYIGYVQKEMQYFAIAIHTYLPALLGDKLVMQQKQLYRLRTQILKQCDIIMICGKQVTRDMKQEILYAIKQHKQIVVFSTKAFNIVMKMIRTSGENEFALQYDDKNPKLAQTPVLENYDDFISLGCG